MIYLIREYIKYCLIAKNRHGVHSPFVYDFNDVCLRLPINKFTKKKFKEFKEKLYANQTEIKVNDFGAGSKRLRQKRTVSKIAKVSGSSNKYAKLLYRLVAHYQPKHVLELGTSVGLGSYMLAAASDQVSITSVEACESTQDIAKRNFPAAELIKVNFVNDRFEHFLQNLDEKVVFDLVFIDGDHQKKSLFKQLDLLKNHIHDETIILLDDIRWSKDMLEAWKKIIDLEDYHLSIDLFKMGLIMPRKHQEKEYFVIKY